MMTKKLSCSLALLVVLLFAASSFAAIPVEVSAGKGTVVTLKNRSERVSLSDPSIADLILISPKELLVNGKKIGTTSIIVWDKEGKRTFFDVFVIGDIGELLEQVRALAPDSDVTVEMAGASVILKGTLKDTETVKKIEEVSKAYAPKVINFLRVEEPQQVQLEVKVVQIDKTKLKELGVSALSKGSAGDGAIGIVGFPGGNLGGAAAGTAVTPGITGFDLENLVPQVGVSHFDAGVSVFLRALASKGNTKILAEPNLVVRSGEKGSFHAGSEIPVQVIEGTGADRSVSITYKKVGVILDFAPEVLEDGTIRLKIAPAAVSSFQYGTIEGINAPTFNTRSVSTSVDLKEGESFILAGLLSEEMKKNMSKIPLLGDIPILGALFRSTRDELAKTELAFFVTPRLVRPNAPGNVPELPGDKGLTPEEEREFNWVPVPWGGKTAKEAEPAEAE